MALGDQTQTKVYHIGRGSLYFKKDGDTGYRLLMNAPSLTFNQDIEELKHYSSRSGISTVDKTVIIRQELMASFTLDDKKMINEEMFYMATGTTTSTQAAQNAQTVNITVGSGTLKEGVYEIGAYNLSSVTVELQGGSPDYTLNTDYEIDLVQGLIYVPSDSSIPSAGTITVTYNQALTTIELISAATATTVKGHFMYCSDPPVGIKKKVKGYGSLKPAGEVAEITDEWQELTFELEFEDHASYTGLVDIRKFGTVT